jgi:hypothetical protein
MLLSLLGCIYVYVGCICACICVTNTIGTIPLPLPSWEAMVSVLDLETDFPDRVFAVFHSPSKYMLGWYLK